MPFSSITFIFLFLPISLILFYILPYRGWRNAILVLSSLVFFAWSDPKHIHVLFISILINYLWGLFISKAKDQEAEKTAKTHLWIGIVLNLLLLGFYKYTGFFLDALNAVLPVTISNNQYGLPLGISFFTFSGISYILNTCDSEKHPTYHDQDQRISMLNDWRNLLKFLTKPAGLNGQYHTIKCTPNDKVPACAMPKTG